MRSQSIDSAKQKHPRARRTSLTGRRKTAPGLSVRDSLQNLGYNLATSGYGPSAPVGVGSDSPSVTLSIDDATRASFAPITIDDDEHTLASQLSNNNNNNPSSNKNNLPNNNSSIIDLTSPQKRLPPPLKIDARTFKLILETTSNHLAQKGTAKSFQIFQTILNGAQSSDIERSLNRNSTRGNSQPSELTDTLNRLSSLNLTTFTFPPTSHTPAYTSFRSTLETHITHLRLGRIPNVKSTINHSRDLEEVLKSCFEVPKESKGNWGTGIPGGMMGMGYDEYLRLFEKR